MESKEVKFEKDYPVLIITMLLHNVSYFCNLMECVSISSIVHYLNIPSSSFNRTKLDLSQWN